MEDVNIKLLITVLDSELDDEEIQDSVQEIKTDLLETDGVIEAELIPLSEAPPDSKSIGGFLLNKLRALVGIDFLKSAVLAIGQHVYGSPIEIEAEGGGRKLKIKINRPDDLQKVMPEVEKFINGL